MLNNINTVNTEYNIDVMLHNIDITNVYTILHLCYIRYLLNSNHVSMHYRDDHVCNNLTPLFEFILHLVTIIMFGYY